MEACRLGGEQFLSAGEACFASDSTEYETEFYQLRFTASHSTSSKVGI
jgi:hypothetical protein